jgi:hypothetical protein
MAPGERNQGASSSKKSVDDILRGLVVGPNQKSNLLGAAHQETSNGLRKKGLATGRKVKLKVHTMQMRRTCH